MTFRRSRRVAAEALRGKRRNEVAKKKATGKCKVVKAVAAVAAVASSSPVPKGVSGLTTSPFFSPSRDCSSFSKISLGAKSPGKGSPGTKKGGERTTSFEPLWSGKFPELANKNVQVHTLILGTHPSIKSLSEDQYYGHAQNAFWWIAGDCLGFRRARGVSPSTGKPYKFSSTLRHDNNRIVPYEDQVRILVSRGFAVWDVIGSCQREGSLDSAIKNEAPNDIRGFCERHPTVKRIVLANGGTGSKYFVKHNKDWWESGDLKPGKNKESQKAFGKFAKVTDNFRDANITCVSAVSVSPAAAKYTYAQKREFWEENVYRPGLRDFEANLLSK